MISLILEKANIRSHLGKIAIGAGTAGLAASAASEHYKDEAIAAEEAGNKLEAIKASRAAKRLSHAGTSALTAAGILGAKAAMSKKKNADATHLSQMGAI